MDRALRQAAEGGLSQGDVDFGRQMWARCEALTAGEGRAGLISCSSPLCTIVLRCCVVVAGLAGDLTEQLRVLLEPTKASRLAGDYRSGKRISMRKVVAYIASNFRKDKIWLRRTRPDKRQYQVR